MRGRPVSAFWHRRVVTCRSLRRLHRPSRQNAVGAAPGHLYNPAMKMICTAVVVGLVSSAHAGTVVLESSRDNTLYETPDGSRSNGAGPVMFSGLNSLADRRRAVMYFDIAGSVPAGSTITAVTLQLHNSSQNASLATLSLHRLQADWGEGTSAAGGAMGGGSGAPSTAGDATWLHTFHDTSLWSTPGGDFNAAASTQTDVGGAGAYMWPSTTALVADVQGFLDAPGANFGWLMRGDEMNPSSGKRFWTREVADAALRPTLTVTYIPTPGTLAPMLGVAAVVSRRRR